MDSPAAPSLSPLRPLPKKLRRRPDRVIIHFDYDCFYAACFQVERPELTSLPLAVQQKQIIVTCNYEARKRGLYKLQLVTEARTVCPEVVIVLGEDLTRFRDHSKTLYSFLKAHIWSGRAERLGFDEVWLDVTDMVDYNTALLTPSRHHDAWFCMDRGDPTRGFSYDATAPAGGVYPQDGLPSLDESSMAEKPDGLAIRLAVASHLAFYLRSKLEEEKGFTSTVGISTNKLLSKLVGNVNKPRAQTTLLPPYGIDVTQSEAASNVQRFLDSHEIGKIPGIGHKTAQQIRGLVKGHHVAYEDALVFQCAKEQVTVRQVRLTESISSEVLERTLGGPGASRGIGGKIWELLHGIDDTEVNLARDVPRQVSIEDTYLHLHDLKAVRQQLGRLSASLIRRMRIDLMTNDHDGTGEAGILDHGMTTEQHDDRGRDGLSPTETVPSERLVPYSAHRWLAHPRTIRLSTRERKPQRSFGRISRSAAMPGFVFNTESPLETLSSKLADELLLPMFTKLVPARSGFDVNLINVAATNMQEIAGEGGTRVGRNIAKMFINQKKVLSSWQVEDKDIPPDYLDGTVSRDHTDLVREVEDTFVAQPGPGKVPADSENSLTRTDTGASAPYPSVHDTNQVPRLEALYQARSEPTLGVRPVMIPAFEPCGTADGAVPLHAMHGSEDAIILSQNSTASSCANDAMLLDKWDSDDEQSDYPSLAGACKMCGALMPMFALEAHMRFHNVPD